MSRTFRPKSALKPRGQARKNFDEAKLIRLGQSMLAHGQQQPIKIFPDDTILYGERRWRAAMVTKEITDLWVDVVDGPIDRKQEAVLRIAENKHREDWTAYEEWLACEEVLDLDPAMTSKDVAELLKLDPSMVTRILSLSKCSAEVQEAARQGSIGVGDWYAISKADTPEAQSALLNKKLAGATRDDIEREGRKHRNGTVQAVRTSSIRMTLPSGITLVLKGADISLDDAIDALPEAQKEMRKAREQGHDVKTFQALLKKREATGT